MQKVTIYFDDNSWKKVVYHKIKLQQESVKKNISNSDAVNDILEKLK